jgi:hypothetical protein
VRGGKGIAGKRGLSPSNIDLLIFSLVSSECIKPVFPFLANIDLFLFWIPLDAFYPFGVDPAVLQIL